MKPTSGTKTARSAAAKLTPPPLAAATHPLTPAEQARIAALQATVAPELGLQRQYPLADVLEEQPIFSPGQGLVVSLSMLTPLMDTAALTAWLERQPRAARENVGRWTLGHLLPGNHPGGVWSALLPGLLLGCRQIVRPSSRLRAYTEKVVARLAAEFGAATQSAGNGPPPCELRDWDRADGAAAERLAAFLSACDAVTVQGSDLTGDSIQRAWAALPETKRPRLIVFRGRLTIAAVDCVAAANRHQLAADAAMHLAIGEQRGCLCPHGVMLVGPAKARAAFLERLATAFTELDELAPPQAAGAAEEQLAVAYQHRVYSELARARTAGFAVRELHGQDGGGRGVAARLWSVPLSEPPLPLTLRSYSVWQADTAAAAAEAIAAWETPLQAIGCVPNAAAMQKPFAQLNAWVTDLDQLHSPPVDWPQDGQNLLTRLIDLAK